MRGLSQSIDFTGGRNFKVQFENKVEPEQVRELIASKFGDANVSVIAIGADGKTVRISTNYRIEEEGNNIDSEIEAYLYETYRKCLTGCFHACHCYRTFNGSLIEHIRFTLQGSIFIQIFQRTQQTVR